AAEGLRHRANDAAITGRDDALLTVLQGKGKVKDYLDVKDEAKEGQAKDKELGLDNPLAKVVIWTGGLEKEEKKKDAKDTKKDDKQEAKKDEKKDARKDDKEAKKDDKEAKKDDKKEAKKDDKQEAKKDEKKDAEKQEEPRINPKATPV